MRQQNIPLVFFDRIVEDFQGSNVSSVMVDDYQGAYQVVTHLIEQGCTRIAHFTGPLHLSIHKNRHQGYRDALTNHGLTVDELLGLNELDVDHMLHPGERLRVVAPRALTAGG